MILTRQTCGQRSSMAAGSKHQALALASYVSQRIWWMFPVPKCRREWNLGLCSFSILAKSLECSCAVKTHDKFGGWRNAFCNRKSPPSSRILFANLKVSHKPGDVTFLYILTLGTFTKLHGKMKSLLMCLLPTAMLERWPHVCQVKITFHNKHDSNLKFSITWWQLFASAEDVHRRIADRSLHFDIKNICQIYTGK